MTKKCTLYAVSVLCVLFLSLASVQTSWSQTIYKQEKGLFTGIPTLHFSSGQLQSFNRIGPWAGYRFNKNMDLRIHVEFINSEERLLSEEFSLTNIGLTSGYTHHMPRLKWRSSLSIYRIINVNIGEHARFSPEGLSATASSGLYVPVKLSNRITILPQGNLHAGTGNAQIPNGTLSGHSDGFFASTSLGLDLNMAFTPFTFTLGVGYVFSLTDQDDLTPNSGMFINMAFNF